MLSPFLKLLVWLSIWSTSVALWWVVGVFFSFKLESCISFRACKVLSLWSLCCENCFSGGGVPMNWRPLLALDNRGFAELYERDVLMVFFFGDEMKGLKSLLLILYF